MKIWHSLSSKKSPKRYLELQRHIKGISHKVLSESSHELEEDGLISKTTFNKVPPRVEFKLTEEGQALMPALEMIEAFGKKSSMKIIPYNMR